MNILAIIPARGGSKGIQRKNVQPLNGIPLLSYTIKAALNSKRVNRVVLSTDDEAIADLGRAEGAEVPFMRPQDLAEDASTLEPVMDHLLHQLYITDNYTPDIFVLLQPTLPLRTGKHIDEAIALFDSTDANSIIAVSTPMEHPAEMVTFQDGKIEFLLPKGRQLVNNQRQGYPDCYFLNGAIYAVRTEAYLNQNTRYAQPALPYHMSPLDSIDIDAPHDMVIAELLLKQRDNVNEPWNFA